MNQDEDPLGTEILYYRQMIADLQKSYEMAAKPFFDRLMQLESMRRTRLVLRIEDYEKFIGASNPVAIEKQA